ncbi:MAG: citrate synthase [Mucispirillum sp.]|nr:citrate synthase [Mucispirillum sp.]
MSYDTFSEECSAVKEHLIYNLSDSMREAAEMDLELFKQYGVKRGLRNEDGTGVLVGLTRIGNVVGYEKTEAGLTPIPGKLYYRGINVDDMVHSLLKEKRLGFEEVSYLLLSGNLPDKKSLEEFKLTIASEMPLDKKTKLHMIDLEGSDIMNILARSVLEMYIHDPNPNDVSNENLMRQSLHLISKFPTIISYAYHVLRHAFNGRTMHIRHPKEDLSLAENLLFMLKGEDYTELDARTLDLLLLLQADHGGGNNSTFTVRVTSSTMTDTYSSIASGIGSLKGPLHGGANLMVADMLDHLKENIKHWDDRDEIDSYLYKILNKEAYNRTGLIYGIGHAVYTISDPRSILLKELAVDLAKEKNRSDEMAFLDLVESRAINAFGNFKKGSRKSVSSNIDFYSGFVYDMIGIPKEIFTPLFAMARIVGWCAHRNEEITFAGKRIIRPGYSSIAPEKPYIDMENR